MESIKHVAIIMDGNGRWATERSRPRVWGHVRGSYSVSQIVEKANDLGLKALTLYAFSTENWKRPADEIQILFKILDKFLIKEKRRILANKIQFKVIGDITKLPDFTVEKIKNLERETKDHQGLKLTFCFGYGARSEIIEAFNKFRTLYPDTPITEDDLSRFMMNPESGDVDLLIRTGGEQRVSNFLLWQIAYAELFFTSTKWPDFTQQEFQRILEVVSKRERRFGSLSPNSSKNLDEIYTYEPTVHSFNQTPSFSHYV
jgi:undecaprenyl diphosphate synthase